MGFWMGFLVIAMFALGWSLGRMNGELHAKMARHTLSHFYMTVALDMAEKPAGSFERSRTVRLVSATEPYDYEREERE